MNIVFMGTPHFAATLLQRLVDMPTFCVQAVYCQPDRPAGRGQKIVHSPVKALALSLNLLIMQPLHFKAAADIERLKVFKPDFLVVAAYGLLLPQSVLDIPLLAPLNVHASLLPRYRGAAPIQRAIMQGEKFTGVSIMRMEASLDTGPVYAVREIPIANHTAGTLEAALAALGAEALLETLAQFRIATVQALPQEDSLATYAAKITKADGTIDWNRPAHVIHNHIRGLSPKPGAWSTFFVDTQRPLRLGLSPGTVGPPCHAPAGAWYCLPDGSIAVSTADYYYILSTVRPENRKALPVRDFINSYFLRVQPSGDVQPLVRRV